MSLFATCAFCGSPFSTETTSIAEISARLLMLSSELVAMCGVAMKFGS